MFAHPICRKKFFLGVAMIVCTSVPAFGQLLGEKDLTRQDTQSPVQAPSKADLAQKSENYCDPGGGVADGEAIMPDFPVLRFSITKALLNADRGKLNLNVTAELRNLGGGLISIPWSDHRVAQALTSTSGDTQDFGLTVATIDLFVGDAFSKDPALSLKGQAVLWMQPGNQEQSVMLRPGQWVNVTFGAVVLCKLADANECVKRLHKEGLNVSAWWYQRELTTQMKGYCIYLNGAYSQLEIESKSTAVQLEIPDNFEFQKP